MKSPDNIFLGEEEYILHTYKRIPIEISHGEGVYLFTTDGNKQLDFFSGRAVNALDYGNKKGIQAIEEQIKKFIHLSNYYVNSLQIELAEKLVKYSGFSKIFFANSGTEAVEASLKLIRKHFGPDKKIITFSNAFHGRTYGSLSLSGKDNYKKYFAPLLPNIVQLELNNVEQLKDIIDRNTAAVYLEFIQGEGGIQVASNHFISRRINWEPKAGNLISLARELGVSTDSFIFLDDNPVEREAMRTLLPEVLTLQMPDRPADIPEFIRHIWAFDRLKATREDQRRTDLYRQARERENLRQTAATIEDFLAGLNLKLDIQSLDDSHLARA